MDDLPGRTRRADDEIRVAIVDDHALIRIGLRSLIDAVPGLECVAAAADADELGATAANGAFEVVVLDYHLPLVNGLELCRRLKTDGRARAVVLYSAYADPALVVPAVVAGVDAIVHKGAPARELLAAIHTVAGGGRCLQAPGPGLLEAAGTVLDAEDLPILGMLVAGTPREEIVTTLRLDAAQLEQRIDVMIARLRPRPRNARRGGD